MALDQGTTSFKFKELSFENNMNEYVVPYFRIFKLFILCVWKVLPQSQIAMLFLS